MKKIRRNVQLTQYEYEALTRFAKENGMSFSECVIKAALAERARFLCKGVYQVVERLDRARVVKAACEVVTKGKKS